MSDRIQAMNKEELLKRCCKFAGESGTWETDDLEQFFHRFRPTGDGLGEIYDGVEHGDAVTQRIKAVMRMDGADTGMAVECRNPKPTDDAKALSLAKKAISNINKLAGELGDEELEEMFRPAGFEMKSGQLSKYRQNNLTHDRFCVMCEVADGIMFDSKAAGAVMFEAAYTLAHNFPLAYNIQWPIYAADFKTKDPFKPFFDMWCQKVEWRFNKDNHVEVFTPKAG